MKFNLKLLGFRIGERRRELKMTQESLAERVGVTEKHISAIENGKTRPRIELLLSIAEALNVTTDYFTLGIVKNSKAEGIEDLLRVCSDDDIEAIYKIVKMFSDRQQKK